MDRQDSENMYPRDKDELLRDFTVANKLHDIRNAENLRHLLAPKWWEAVVLLVQFVAAVGLLASIMQHAAVREDPYLRLTAFWGALTLLSLVMGFEFMIFKLYHLRRANEIALRGLQELNKRLEAAEKALHEERALRAGTPAHDADETE
jgi:hypothetical protein